MNQIKTLAPHVADLIAAGEVVERPASVVKELLENAIDAGATVVTVEIQRGGMAYIRVTDNGCGIPADQAETAFLRHATSKIQTEYDLEAIGTLGFRGEALAAISAVSRTELLTRTADSSLGISVTLEGGTVTEKQEAGCPLGTTMVVRDLFYNTPARLKFMKRDAAESAAVSGVVQRTALSHPEVSIRFLRDGKEELLTPGDGQLHSALYAVLGRDNALGYIPCQGTGEGDIFVFGFISLPTCCRGSRACQHFFVNGRYVKSRTMQAALEEGYKNQKMVGKFPGCVLHIRVGLGKVDVNVHPAKTEVKFQSEKYLFDAVYYAVRTALEGDQTRPALQVTERRERVPAHDTVTPNQTFFRQMTAQTYRQSAAAEQSASRKKPLPLYSPATGWTDKPGTLRETPAVQRNGSVRRGTLPGLNSLTPPPGAVSGGNSPGTEKVQPPDQRMSGEKSHLDEEISQLKMAPAEGENPVVSESDVTPATPDWRVVGEVLNTYIIVEQGDSILMIDKHAAHERMNFDRLKAQDYRPMPQLLLTPLVFTPAPEEGAVLLEQLPLLAEFGFEVEDFGGGSLIVRQLPDGLDAGEGEAALCELAERLLTTGGRADPAAARDELLHTIACKAAIKGGWKTSQEEREIVARAVVSGQVKYCPHGRPVAIELTRYQLEKQFGRTGG